MSSVVYGGREGMPEEGILPASLRLTSDAAVEETSPPRWHRYCPPAHRPGGRGRVAGRRVSAVSSRLLARPAHQHPYRNTGAPE